MVEVRIITRQGNTIETVAESMDDAKKLLGQPFVVIDGGDRFTAVAVSSIDLFDARDVGEPRPESGD